VIGRCGRLGWAAIAVGALAGSALASGGSPVSFSSATGYPTGLKFTSFVAAGDLNGDGRADAVVSNFRTRILFALPGGRLSSPRNLDPQGGRVAIADFDGDGNRDVVRLSDRDGNPRSRRSAVLFGNGRGGFPRRTRFEAPGRPLYNHLNDPAVGDFNRDRKPDLAVPEAGNSQPGVWILLGDGKGNFPTQKQYPTRGAFADQAAIADFDRDHNPDVAVAVARDEISNPDGPGGLQVLFGDGTGDFPRAATSRAGDRLVSVAAGNLNGDRAPDLAVVNGNPIPQDPKPTELRVLLGDGRGGFSRPHRYRLGWTLASVVMADFDRDGDRDLAATNDIPARRRETPVRVLTGNGRGRFSPARRFVVGRTDYAPGRMAAADFNRDRKPDLILARGSDGRVSVLLNTTGR